jgi:hypothetical protein
MGIPRLLLVLSENWTLVSARDLRGLVRIAAEAEQAGVDRVMLSEHVDSGYCALPGGQGRSAITDSTSRSTTSGSSRSHGAAADRSGGSVGRACIRRCRGDWSATAPASIRSARSATTTWTRCGPPCSRPAAIRTRSNSSGGIRDHFTDPHGPPDVGLALESVPSQPARGFTTICVKPSMFVNDAKDIGQFCRDLVRRVGEISPYPEVPEEVRR